MATTPPVVMAPPWEEAKSRRRGSVRRSPHARLTGSGGADLRLWLLHGTKSRRTTHDRRPHAGVPLHPELWWPPPGSGRRRPMGIRRATHSASIF